MRQSINFILAASIFFSCSTRKASSNLSELNKLGQNPLWFVDSVETKFDLVKTIYPMDISNISVLLPKSAKKHLGDRAMDGAVYITTVSTAKMKYWSFFCSKSNYYKQSISNYRADSAALYILNGMQLSDSAIGTLYLIDKKNLKHLQFVRLDSTQSATMNLDHKKQFALHIKAKRPKDLKTHKNWK